MSGHTFVCYAREDEDFVLKLASKLKSRGARVWVDKQDIPSAADWDRAIDQAIKDSAHFLIVLSPHAESSQEVRGELRMALDKEKPVVPILYKNCEIPRQLRTIQYIDCLSVSPDDERVLGQILQALGGTQSIASHAAALFGTDKSQHSPDLRYGLLSGSRGGAESGRRFPPIERPLSTAATDPTIPTDSGTPALKVADARQGPSTPVSPTEMVVCWWCNKHVENRYLKEHYEQNHSGKSVPADDKLRKVSSGPTSEERKEIEEEAGEGDPESFGYCPACAGQVKSKNLVAHWNRHWLK